MLYALSAAGLAIALLAIASPVRGVNAWIFAAALTPCWVGAFAPGLNFVQPASIFAAFMIGGIILAGRRRHPARFRPKPWDAGPLVLLGLAALAVHSGTRNSIPKEVLLLWLLPYIIGRWAGLIDPSRVGRFIAKLAAIIGGLGVLELATSYHPFKNLDTSSPLGFWAAILQRGGLDRSEVTFGHPLALGGFLALSVPFAIYYLTGKARAICLLLILAGVLSTLSRGPALAALLALALSLFPGRGLVVQHAGRLRVFAVAAVALAVPVFAMVSSSTATRQELNSTASYRSDLYSLTKFVRPLGEGRNAVFDPTLKEYTFVGYGSVDNALLNLALTVGWILAGLLILGLAVFLLRYLAGRGGPAGIALLGQIPLFLSVALITQYEAFVWLIAGWAVSEIGRFSRREALGRAASQQEQPHRPGPLPPPGRHHAPQGA